MDKKLLPINSIGLSVRSSNALRRTGIHTVGDLLNYPAEDLHNINNLGAKSIDEILAKIHELKNSADSEKLETKTAPPAEDFEIWFSDNSNRESVFIHLKEKETKVSVLPLLSAKSYNILTFSGYIYLWQIILFDESDLMNIPKMDTLCADEIYRHSMYYVKENLWKTIAKKPEKPAEESSAKPEEEFLSVYDILASDTHRRIIEEYAKLNDVPLIGTSLSNRAKNQLLRKGYTNLSDIILMTPEEIGKLKNIGATTIDSTTTVINDYLKKHSTAIIAFAKGDENSFIDNEFVRTKIMTIYESIGFKGLSLAEITEKLALPDSITQESIKKAIGSLIAEHKLVYVDFRCHRIFERFIDVLEDCPDINDRSREIIKRRLAGETLESIAQTFDLTRERVRQVQTKDTKKVKYFHATKTNHSLFDEDYYKYLFETYNFDRRDAEKWFGVPSYIWNYFDSCGIKQGKNDLNSAIEDIGNLDAGLRLKIKNYLNRNKLYVDGVWVPKKRSEIEEIVVRKFCKENTTFTEFTNIYNQFLTDMEVDPADNIHYTDDVIRSRKNRLSESRYLFWTLNEKIRYYDIDSRDYTEFLDAINLDSFENIEISTLKLFRAYPNVMQKYDIRNHYELHNLLRKIIPEGSYHDFHCSRTPDIRFGTFDRDQAIFDIMSANAPVSNQDLADLINDEYGYDQGVVMSTYLQPLSKYYHQGVYSVDQKKMSSENLAILDSALIEDFYFIDELKKIYSDKVTSADLSEITPYNLKVLGFQVFSKHALRNYPSLEAYFETLLTKNDITYLTSLKQRYTSIPTFYGKLMELKRNLDIIEFSPNQCIHIRKLEKSRITKDVLYDFCDAVCDFVTDNDCFSIQSIRQDGFEHELFDPGFDNWFYSNVLLNEEKLSSATIYNNFIFCKGKKEITRKSFGYEIIKKHGSIDMYDLINELSDRFGCKPDDKWDITFTLNKSEVHYDKILDRFYASSDLYYRELDEAGGI